MADIVELEILPPLARCFVYCEVRCMRDCCGIDAISTDADRIAEWSRRRGSEATRQALMQLGDAIVAVEDRSQIVSSDFLNHITNDEAEREELLSFLRAFQAALLAVN